MFRGFRYVYPRDGAPEKIVRLALAGRFYGIELAADPKEFPDPKIMDRAFFEAGITVAVLDPGSGLTPEVLYRTVDFAAAIHAQAVVVSWADLTDPENLCAYAAQKQILICTNRLPEKEIFNLKALWDLADPEFIPPAEQVAHVRIGGYVEPELLSRQLKQLRAVHYRGFITMAQPLSEEPTVQLREFLWNVDRLDTKAALADVPLPPLYPPQGHPRIMFRAEDIPAIRSRMQAPQNADALGRYHAALQPDAQIFLSPDTRLEMEKMTPEELQQCKNRDRGMGAADTKYQHIRADILDRIEIRAFAYALEGDEIIGRSAVDAILVYLQNCVALVYDDLGQLIFTAAEVYDWCYNLFAPEEREQLTEGVLDLARRLEIGWPPLKQSALSGHGVESQLFRDLFSFGAALWDEHPEIYDVTAGLLFWQFIPARRFFNAARMNPQGGQYTIYRAPWELLCTALLRGMRMPDLFGPSQGHLLDWLLWARRPDGCCFADGDNSVHNLPPVDYYERKDWPEIQYYTDELDWLTFGPKASEDGVTDQLYDNTAKRCYILAASLYKNPYYKEEARLCMPGYRLPEPHRNRTINTVEFLLHNDPYLEPKPMSQLPKVQYFPHPKGSALVRTGWSQDRYSRDVLCEMKINEYWTTGHQHQDAGAFQLYYKGMLAIDSGYYQSRIVIFDWTKRRTLNNGNTGCGGAHDNNYNSATIAHNCMLVVDPEEEGELARPMGGQPMMTSSYRNLDAFLLAEKNRIGQVLGFSHRQGVTCLAGEISRAYGSKVIDYTRSFAFVEFSEGDCPAALFVYDDITSASRDFKKYWVCHGIHPPQTQGSRSIFQVTERGYNGRLTVDTLLPRQEDLEVTAILDPTDFDVFGVKYPAALYPHRRNDTGACRIMVSPKQARNRDRFLHVLQVSDGDARPMTQPVMLEGQGWRGTVLADTAVLFLDPDTETVEAELPKLCRRAVLCGTLGSWQQEGLNLTVAEGENSLLLENVRTIRIRRL